MSIRLVLVHRIAAMGDTFNIDEFCAVVRKLGRCWRLHRKSWPSDFQEAFATILWETRLVIRPIYKISTNMISGDTGGTVVNLSDVLGFTKRLHYHQEHLRSRLGNIWQR